MPDLGAGPPLMCAGVTIGLRASSRFCTTPNIARSISGGADTIASSLSAFFSRVLCERALNLCSPI